MEKVHFFPMTIEDYEEVRALWMTIQGFGIRALDDSREDIGRFIARNPTTSVAPMGDREPCITSALPENTAAAASEPAWSVTACISCV